MKRFNTVTKQTRVKAAARVRALTALISFSAVGLLIGATVPTLGPSSAFAQPKKGITFELAPNPKFLACLAQFPSDPTTSVIN